MQNNVLEGYSHLSTAAVAAHFLSLHSSFDSYFVCCPTVICALLLLECSEHRLLFHCDLVAFARVRTSNGYNDDDGRSAGNGAHGAFEDRDASHRAETRYC